MEYKYGDSWEKFPIKEGEIWNIDGVNKVSVHNICNELPKFVFDADILFIDPPWNLGNLNCFYTKAKRKDYHKDFDIFIEVLFKRIKEINPNICYIEIGNQYKNIFYEKLKLIYKYTQKWKVTYYKKNPCNILRGSHISYTNLNFSGLDEADCIKIIAEKEEYKTIGDICMGQGLVGLAAYNSGKRFVGTELNCRRLAVLLDKLNKKGVKICKNGKG